VPKTNNRNDHPCPKLRIYRNHNHLLNVIWLCNLTFAGTGNSNYFNLKYSFCHPLNSSTPLASPSAASLTAVILHKIGHGPFLPYPFQFIHYHHIFRHHRQISLYKLSFCAFCFNATSKFTPIFELAR
jgi:hypothetical protein